MVHLSINYFRQKINEISQKTLELWCVEFIGVRRRQSGFVRCAVYPIKYYQIEPPPPVPRLAYKRILQSRTSGPEGFAGRNTPAAPARSTASSSPESQSSSVDEPP